MRSVITTLLLICAGCINAGAQGVYFRAGMGYDVPTPGQTKDQLGNLLNGSRINKTTTIADYNIKPASYTAGLHSVLSGGYMFTPHIGVEIAADISLATRKYTFTDYNLTNSTGTNYNLSYTRQAKNTITFIPALVLQTSVARKWDVYTRIGLALPTNSHLTRNGYLNYFSTGETQQQTWTDKNYFSPGFNAAAGVTYNVSRNVAIWAEASILYLALSRKESDLEALSINGTSYNMNQISNKVVHYHKNGTTNPATNDEQTFSQPYSNIGFTAGITYRFKHISRSAVKAK